MREQFKNKGNAINQSLPSNKKQDSTIQQRSRQQPSQAGTKQEQHSANQKKGVSSTQGKSTGKSDKWQK